MTKNQIDYFSAKEQEKHNRATEQETIRSNKKKEAISEFQAREDAEHLRRQDTINEQHYKRMDAENARHQQVSEALTAQSNAITQAHYERSDANTATANLINLGNLEETKRHQRVMESLTESLNASQIRLNNSAILLNSAKEIEAQAHATNYFNQNELLRNQSLTEVMKTEVTKKQALLTQAQLEKTVADTVAVKYNTAANLLGGIGRFIGGLRGISFMTPSYSGYQSSTTYNSTTGLYE